MLTIPTAGITPIAALMVVMPVRKTVALAKVALVIPMLLSMLLIAKVYVVPAIGVCRTVLWTHDARRDAPQECGRAQPGQCGRSTMCSLV